MPKRAKSSARWLKEHFDDVYVKRAQAEGWRSRAVFKLEEIDRRDHLLRPGITLVDLGAAPGGWSQYAQRSLKVKAASSPWTSCRWSPWQAWNFCRAIFRMKRS